MPVSREKSRLGGTSASLRLRRPDIPVVPDRDPVRSLRRLLGAFSNVFPYEPRSCFQALLARFLRELGPVPCADQPVLPSILLDDFDLKSRAQELFSTGRSHSVVAVLGHRLRAIGDLDRMDPLGPGIGVVTSAVPVPVRLECEGRSHAISIHNARLTHSLRLDLRSWLVTDRSRDGHDRSGLGVTRSHRRSSLSVRTSWRGSRAPSQPFRRHVGERGRLCASHRSPRRTQNPPPSTHTPPGTPTYATRHLGRALLGLGSGPVHLAPVLEVGAEGLERRTSGYRKPPFWKSRQRVVVA
jgi:hypothetical protein